MSDHSIEITDEEIEEFTSNSFNGQAPSFRPILHIWREVLKPAATERDEPVTAAFAHKITASYRELNFADLPAYISRYFDKIATLAAIVDVEIATDEECLTYTSPEEDVEHNSQHYKQVLTDWQVQIVEWEKQWDCTDPLAGVELAALSEVHKMFFGPTGLTSYLDNIQFQFTEADQAALLAVLQDVKDRKDRKDGDE